MNDSTNYGNYDARNDWDIVWNDDEPWDRGYPDIDWNFHGTMCLSVIGATTNNGKGVFGIAGGWQDSGVRDHGVRVAEYRNYDSDSSCANYHLAVDTALSRGASIIHMAQFRIPLSPAFWQRVYSAIDAGCLFVVPIDCDGATETEIATLRRDPDYAHGIITVGASNKNDLRSYEGYEGDDLDLVAPGDSIPVAYGLENHPYMSNFEGASASSSVLAGIAALTLSMNPTLTNRELKKYVGEREGPAMEFTLNMRNKKIL